MTPADFITVSRMVVAPLLLLVAANGNLGWFTGLAAIGLASDAIDGPVARKLNLDAAWGARFDSNADLTFYSAGLVGLAVLVPSRLVADWALFTIAAIAYATPHVVALCKFGTITSYHTILDRISLVMMVAALFFWLWFDTILPLQAAVTVLVVSALEELVMTWKLPQPRENIAHVFRLFTRSPRRREHAFRR